MGPAAWPAHPCALRAKLVRPKDTKINTENTKECSKDSETSGMDIKYEEKQKFTKLKRS